MIYLLRINNLFLVLLTYYIWLGKGFFPQNF